MKHIYINVLCLWVSIYSRSYGEILAIGKVSVGCLLNWGK